MTALFLLFLAAPVVNMQADKQDGKLLVIITERVVTVTGGVIENGIIFIKDGKITKIAPRLPIPHSAKVIHAEKLSAYPGMVLARTNIGLESYLGGDVKSTVEPAIWPFEKDFDAVLRSGITAMGLAPAGSGLLAPQGLVIRPLKRKKKDIILCSSNFLCMNFSATSKKSLANMLKAKGNDPVSLAAAGKLSVIISSEDANSTLHLLDVIMPQRAMKKSILQEGDVVNAIPNLLKAKIPCIFRSRLYAPPSTIFERNPAAEIAKARIPVCLLPRTDTPGAIETFRFDVARLIRSGMPKEAALHAITIIPAQLLGIDWRIGSLEKGKDADILLMDGDIFDFKTRIQKIFIAGEEVFPREEK